MSVADAHSSWSFRPLTAVDLPLLQAWLRRPHIARWWPSPASFEEFAAAFSDHLDPRSTTCGYLALLDGAPAGFVQCYHVMGTGGDWWPDETDPGARGIDQFIADGDALGRGLGSAMIDAFVARLFEDPAVTGVQVDPAPDNGRAIGACRRAGFVAQGETMTPDGPALRMVRRRGGAVSSRRMDSQPLGALIIGDEILTGKRQDKHLAHVIETLAHRGLTLAFAHYVGDDRARLTALLRETFSSGTILFSFGGIGATPDDQTRQAAAAALGVPLERHPEAVAGIEQQFGAAAYPHRVLMAEFPRGASIVPNPVNRVAAFSIRDHHFFPGFPQMAWPMLDWVLATHYPDMVRAQPVERTLVVHDVGESQLLPLMDENVARYPRVKLFSLPAFVANGRRRLELGVRGEQADVDAAFEHLRAGVVAAGHRFEVATP